MRGLLEAIGATYSIETQGDGFSVKARYGGKLIGTLYIERPKRLTKECQSDLDAVSAEEGRKLEPRFVGWVSVHDDMQRSGVGTRLYHAALSELAKRGEVLVPATCAGKTMTRESGKIWSNLMRKYRVRGQVLIPW